MDMNFTDKVVVVTGASKGIGLAVSQAFAAEGAHVIAGARRNTAELQALEAAGSATFVAADLATPDGPRALIAAAAERGGIDVLVNNAGAVTPRFDGILSVTDEEWDAALAVNFLSAVRTTREAIPHMLARGGGSVVMIGSVNATLPEWNIVDYSATKAALASYAKSVSKEFGPKGIRVNTVSPGPVSTDLWLGDGGVAAQFATVTGATPDEIVASAVAGSATQRFTTAQEVADSRCSWRASARPTRPAPTSTSTAVTSLPSRHHRARGDLSMTDMAALRAHHRGGPEVLTFERAPVPVPADGEVLIAVHAAAITFDELTWEETWLRDGADRTPTIPSHEVSGVVAATADDVDRLRGRRRGVRADPVRPRRCGRRVRHRARGRPGPPADDGVPRGVGGAAAGGPDRVAGPRRPCAGASG